MRNPITKVTRSLKRDHKKATVVGRKYIGKPAAAGAAVGTALTVASGGVLAPAIPIGAAVGAAAGGFMTWANNWHRKIAQAATVTGNTLNLNGFVLLGTPQNLSRLNATQYLINEKATEIQHMKIPPKGFLEAYLKDAAEMLKDVRVFKDNQEVPTANFYFTRKYLSAPGVAALQQVNVPASVPKPKRSLKPSFSLRKKVAKAVSIVQEPFQPQPMPEVKGEVIATMQQEIADLKAQIKEKAVVEQKTETPTISAAESKVPRQRL